MSVRRPRRACSEGNLDLPHIRPADAEPWNPEHTVGLAAAESTARATLHVWSLEAAGRRLANLRVPESPRLG